MAAPLTLRSHYDHAAHQVVVHLDAHTSLAPGWQLAFTSVTQLTPDEDATCRLVERLSTYHVLEPQPPCALDAGAVWSPAPLHTGHRPRHANDGPVSAYVVARDGNVIQVEVAPMTTEGGGETAPAPEPTSADVPLPLVPYPVRVTVLDPTPLRVATASLRTAHHVAATAWSTVANLEQRLRAATGLGDEAGLAVDALTDNAIAPSAYRLTVRDTHVEVAASTVDGFRFAFVTLAQLFASDGVPRVEIEDAPAFTWRGLHVDLARRWYEPAVVERIIDLAAWRKLAQLHLHLTDDEGWRLPVDGAPDLGEIGGRRGHGLPLPPMLGDGPGPTGRAYTAEEIAGWVEQASALGVTLVPEVDMPAHVHAALTALPELRDPHDHSGARSVQHFVDNVLVPGRAATRTFLEHVVDTLARLFPTSPWIHVGGDEVPDGAWSGSPEVAGFRDRRGLAGTRDVEAEFHRELVQLITTRTGRLVGAWQEAAESGGVQPGDGYVVGWRTADDCRRLAAGGYDVVLAPGWPYYLDMAPDERWSTPGSTWAGTATLDDVCEFVPGDGWTDDERARIIGLQACLWSEHVDSPATFDRLVFPRLDAIAERAWTGRIEGGTASLRARAAALPRLASGEHM